LEEDGLVEAGEVFPFGLHLLRGLLVGVEVEGHGGWWMMVDDGGCFEIIVRMSVCVSE
jgi:hypothetical protein